MGDSANGQLKTPPPQNFVPFVLITRQENAATTKFRPLPNRWVLLHPPSPCFSSPFIPFKTPHTFTPHTLVKPARRLRAPLLPPLFCHQNLFCLSSPHPLNPSTQNVTGPHPASPVVIRADFPLFHLTAYPHSQAISECPFPVSRTHTFTPYASHRVPRGMPFPPAARQRATTRTNDHQHLPHLTSRVPLPRVLCSWPSRCALKLKVLLTRSCE